MSHTIIRFPVITEKTSQKAQAGVYAFDVSIHANKYQIAETVEKMYGVTVGSVRVITRKGKERRVGKKMASKMLADRKIAFVTVTKGTIDLFPKA